MKNNKKTTSCPSNIDPFAGTTTTSGYYQVFHDLPSADICINNNRLKYYDDSNCYLNDGDEFQIELRNTSENRYLVKIKLNGKFISNNGLVIDAYSHHYLDRYIDTNKKFKFNTFMVDDVNETKKQRERNGKVEILFYKELTYPNWNTINYTNTDYTLYSGSWGTSSSNMVINNMTNDGSRSLGNINNSIQSVVNSSEEYASGNLNYQPEVETGRVDEGSKSKQKFQNTSGTFSSFTDKHVVYHILPISHRPPEEIKKIRTYCEECGLRIRKSSWKFCPKCGHEL